MQILILYFATALVFLGLDVIGLRLLIRPVFERHVGDLLVDGFRLVPALVFYLFYVAGLIWFVSLPALRAEAPAQAALGGAFLGALAYGTYEFTKSGNWYYVAYITRDGKNTYKFTYLPEQSFSTTGCF